MHGRMTEIIALNDVVEEFLKFLRVTDPLKFLACRFSQDG